jgi:hypothetical protein
MFLPVGIKAIYDRDMWSLFNEEQQFCAINYKDGFQKSIDDIQ